MQCTFSGINKAYMSAQDRFCHPVHLVFRHLGILQLEIKERGSVRSKAVGRSLHREGACPRLPCPASPACWGPGRRRGWLERRRRPLSFQIGKPAAAGPRRPGRAFLGCLGRESPGVQQAARRNVSRPIAPQGVGGCLGLRKTLPAGSCRSRAAGCCPAGVGGGHIPLSPGDKRPLEAQGLPEAYRRGCGKK